RWAEGGVEPHDFSDGARHRNDCTCAHVSIYRGFGTAIDLDLTLASGLLLRWRAGRRHCDSDRNCARAPPRLVFELAIGQPVRGVRAWLLCHVRAVAIDDDD